MGSADQGLAARKLLRQRAARCDGRGYARSSAASISARAAGRSIARRMRETVGVRSSAIFQACCRWKCRRWRRRQRKTERSERGPSHEMTLNISHWVDVRDGSAFLHRLMVELAGNTQLSLEGDLSRCRFTDDVVMAHDETLTLKRNTIAPKQDFVVLRLTPETVDAIFKQVMAAGSETCHYPRTDRAERRTGVGRI